MQYLNILVGNLETPHVSYLYDCQPLKCAPNSNIVAQAVDDAARNLGNQQKLLLPVTLRCCKIYDCCWYNTKISVLSDVRSTFIAQLCYKIKSHFEDVDQLIAKVKAVIIKNKTRQVKFSAIGCPPQLVPTRWGSWLNAALYYAKVCLKRKQLWKVL